jgi:hypothetical protein
MTFQEDNDKKRLEDLKKLQEDQKRPITIAERLRDIEFRFIKVKVGEKGAFEKSWQESANYKFDDPELLRWLEKGGNYGIVGGYGGLIFIDADKQKARDLAEKLGKTFVVQSGSGGRHYYFLCKGFDKKVVLGRQEEHVGEIQSTGSYVVGPSCRHPSGTRYEVIEDVPIAEITKEQLEEVFAEYLKPQLKETTMTDFNEDFSVDKFKEDYKLVALKILQMEEPSGFRLYLPMVLFGNLGWNVKKALAFIKQNVKWTDYNREDTLKRLREEYDKMREGKTKPISKEKLIEEGLLERIENKTISYNDKLVWLKKIKDMKLERQRFLIDDQLPENSLCLFFGKRQAYKSWLGLNMALRLATGTAWLDKFICSEHRVLFIDEENGIAEMLRRIKKLLAGMKVENWPDNFALLSCENIRLDRADSLEAIKRLIEEYKFEVIFVDVLRRVHSFAEDKADDINLLYNSVLKPLATKYGISWVLLGHSRKTQSRGSEFDIMDELRGSSEFVNVADVIFFADTEGGRMKDQLVLRQAKMRRGPLVKPVLITITEDKEEEGEPISFVFDKYLEEEEGLIGEIVAKAYLDYCLNHAVSLIRTTDIKAFSIKLGYSARSGQRAIDELKKMKVVSGKKSPYKLLTARGEKLPDYEGSEEND